MSITGESERSYRAEIQGAVNLIGDIEEADQTWPRNVRDIRDALLDEMGLAQQSADEWLLCEESRYSLLNIAAKALRLAREIRLSVAKKQ